MNVDTWLSTAPAGAEHTTIIERAASGETWFRLHDDRVQVGITSDGQWAEVMIAKEVITLVPGNWYADLRILRTLLNDPRIVAMLDAAPPA